MQPDEYRIPVRNAAGELVGEAIVDATDFAEMSKKSWHLHEGYAYRYATGRQKIGMHREILGMVAHDGRVCDHINRNRLDNRRSNLREASIALNQQNLPSVAGSASRFRGVSLHAGTSTWAATATLNGERHWLGRHASEITAARIVDRFRLEHMPFAQPDPELVKLDALGIASETHSDAPTRMSDPQWVVLERAAGSRFVRPMQFGGIADRSGGPKIGIEGARNVMKSLRGRGLLERHPTEGGAWVATDAGIEAVKARHEMAKRAATEEQLRAESANHQEARHAA